MTPEGSISSKPRAYRSTFVPRQRTWIEIKEGSHSTIDSVLASHPADLGLILGVPKRFYLPENSSLDVGEIY